jgi:hypothetical protein
MLFCIKSVPLFIPEQCMTSMIYAELYKCCHESCIQVDHKQGALGICRLVKVPLLPFMVIIRREQSSCSLFRVGALVLLEFLHRYGVCNLYGFNDLPPG